MSDLDTSDPSDTGAAGWQPYEPDRTGEPPDAPCPGDLVADPRPADAPPPLPAPNGAGPAAHDEPTTEPPAKPPATVPTGEVAPVLVARRTWAAELGVALVSLALFAWSLGRNGYGNGYYAAAARSMTQSWSNFFFGALDPGGWITVDKPPAALWFQAAFAKLFGFSSWSLLLPSAIAGAAAVWLLIITVRRVWGRTAGFAAGAALAVTPVVLAVSRSNNPDGVLMFAAVAAAWATERAISTRRARWMYIAGAVCGFAFLTKLLAAGLVMPGLWLAYLVAARHTWRRRIVHLLLAVAAFVGVAGVWVGAVQLTPSTSRPYIGGSTDGTALDLIVGYNGLGRVTGNENGSGGGTPGAGGPGGAPVGRPGGFGGATGSGRFTVDEFGGTPGIGRLFNNGMGDQVMWLAPIAGAAVLAGAAVAVRRRRVDGRLGSLVLWAGWAGVTYVVFAFAKGIYHNYYVSLLAPAVAALVGIGAGLAVRAGRTGRVLVVPVLAATAALQYALLRRIPAYAWLRTLVPVGLGIAAVGWIVLACRRGGGARRALMGTVVATGGIALLAPAVWAWNGTRVAQSGTFPAARPAVQGGGGFGAPGGQVPGGPSGNQTARGGFGGGGLSTAMLTWLRSQRTTERWLVAVGSSMQADDAIIGGDSVMPVGGFSGSDPSLSTARLADLVERGGFRFVLGGNAGGPGGGGGSSASTVAAQVCTAVPTSNWGGTGSSALYDCAGKAAAIRSAKLASTGTATTGAGQQPTGQLPGGQQPPAGGAGGFGDPTQNQQFSQCMQANGAPGPAAGNGPPDFGDPAVQQAMQACQRYLTP